MDKIMFGFRHRINAIGTKIKNHQTVYYCRKCSGLISFNMDTMRWSHIDKPINPYCDLCRDYGMICQYPVGRKNKNFCVIWRNYGKV